MSSRAWARAFLFSLTVILQSFPLLMRRWANGSVTHRACSGGVLLAGHPPGNGLAQREAQREAQRKAGVTITARPADRSGQITQRPEGPRTRDDGRER